MKLVSKLLLILFILGLVSVCFSQEENFERKERKRITAIQIHQQKANQGDVDAQFTLGLLNQRGVETLQDTKQAVYWYTKAAEQGHVQAQYELGSLYLFSGDDNVPQDYKQSVKWYTKAAEQGHILAQNKLGHMYEVGEEAPQDYEQAFFWYTKAAEQGHVFAEYARDEMLEKMSQSQIEEVRKLSKELYEKIYSRDK